MSCILIYCRKKEVYLIMTDEFEARFSEFLDSKPYDEAEGALFSMLRAAFAAGWRAAGGLARDEKAPAEGR